MKLKKLTPLWRGLAAVTASCMTLAVIGSSIADNYRSQIDEAFGTQSYITEEDADAKYSADYTAEQLKEKLVEFSINQGEEGAVLLKNTNGVLPLSSTAKVALFGGASYNNYKSGGGNSDAATLVSALTDAGITIDSGVSDAYSGEHGLLGVVTGESEQPGRWPGAPSTVVQTYGFRPNTSLGDYDPNGYQIREADPSKTYEVTGDKATEINANISTALQALNTAADELTDDVIGIVTGGEGNTYYPGVARDSMGNTLNQNPLALSPEEIGVVDFAKEHCSKVIVLLNTCVPMEIQPLVSGEHAVDGIMYVGVPNDYQFKGIVNVLTGKVNATGALMDTYAVSTTSSPAMRNFGGSTWADYTIVATTAGQDPRWNVDVSNETTGSFGGVASYAASTYVVEAEGIYTGYNYYETRYFDSVCNPSYNAKNATEGDAASGGWSYANEMTYPFGFGLSYLDYEQKITAIDVQDSNDGVITATVDVTNKSDKDGKFLVQLYVSQPYTEYDRTNLVEKSAIMFLNSKKVEVAHGATVTTTIEIPTKYIASYDYKTAKTYILDGGDYRFTVANGAHEAVNNVLASLGKTTADGMTADGDGTNVQVWNNGSESITDDSTYSVSAKTNTQITNVADNADINYYLSDADKVTYLSRQNWSGTWPKNYNTIKDGKGYSLADSPKKDEWIKELRNEQYTIKTDEPATEAPADGVKWADIGAQQVMYLDDPMWDQLVARISIDQAIGAIAHGGSQSDALDNIETPVVGQNDGPTGFTGASLDLNNTPDDRTDDFRTALNSQSLMGSSFNPELSYRWGILLGNTGLLTQRYEVWAGGMNYHRTPYNSRNIEYVSEDPMLTNVLGVQLIKGSREKGIIVGPKHIGFNDQEYQRSGVGVYMTEQKLRQTDLRGFEGAFTEADGLGMMIAFNRIGAINASHHVGMNMGIFRGEWGFKGLATTDMMNNAYYFNPEGCIMAGLTMMADFQGNNSTISGGTGDVDATWGYLSVDAVKNDATLVNRARQNLKYQLYAFANSAVLNITTTRVTPWWEAAINAVAIVGGIVFGLSTVAWIVTELLPEKKKEEE